MQKAKLGDSYDFIKRFWSDSLRPIGRLYALSKFVPPDIRNQYTAMTLIPILDSRPDGPFGILLDPDTGILVPPGSRNTETSHAALAFIVQVREELDPEYMICFDQSLDRSQEIRKQLQAKMAFLRERGIASFYYVSHASFLFMTRETRILKAIHDRLTLLGIPSSRIESCDVHEA